MNQPTVLRFGPSARVAHWLTTVLFLVVALTGAALYFPAISTTFGRRALIENVHFYCGLALPLPLLIALVVPGGSEVRRDTRRVSQWRNDEVSELVSFGRIQRQFHDKFNPGQKLNSLLSTAAVAALFATGLGLYFFSVVPVNWRSGVTFVHDVVALCVVALIAGHTMMAVTHRAALRSMITGRMPRAIAEADNGDWVSELDKLAH